MSFQSRNNIEVKKDGNQLFPVFLKLNQLKVLLVGGGNIGLEKLQAVLSNSPETKIDIVSETFLPEVLDFVAAYPEVKLIHRKFESNDLAGQDLVILATGDNSLNAEIRTVARELNVLINVADKPELCDFYLGSIVKKGDLKIAISTNGKSPTIAKRLKEIFQENLPDELDLTLQQMNKLRNTLKGDFSHKVNELNKATALLIKPLTEKEKGKIQRLFVWGAWLIGLGTVCYMFWYSSSVH